MSDHHHGTEPCDTTGRHGMVLFGDGPCFLSHMMMWHCPHDYQVVLEAALDAATAARLAADRAAHGDGLYTFDPEPFPLAELEPRDGVTARTALTGAIVRGHFERGGVPIAQRVTVGVRTLWFRHLELQAGPARPLTYLCVGRGERAYLAHEIQGRPSFDQILVGRFVPGTVRSGGHPLTDDVAELRLDPAQPATLGRAEGIEQRLGPGEVATAGFDLTRSPSFARGFSAGVEIQRELYLEIAEIA
jgi:hypothetical protein